jgi:hypothetical protein
LISLRQSMKELDEAEVAHNAAAKAFAEALETSAAHVVEVDREDAAEFREQVLSLAGRVSHSQAAIELDAARSTFRGELQEYSAKAGSRVRRLREELEAAAAAMQTFAQGVDSSTGQHETVLRHEFRQLEQIADGDDLREIRAVVHQTVHTVRESYEGLKQAQALVIAQLRDEIRVLQSELAQGTRKTEGPAGIFTRRDLERHVDEMLRLNRAFTLVLVGVPEMADLYKSFPPARVDGALAVMVTDLTALARKLEPKAVVGNWGSRVYGVVTAARVPVDHWQRELNVSHVFELNRIPRTLKIAPRLGTVEHKPGEFPNAFFEQVAATAELVTKCSL